MMKTMKDVKECEFVLILDKFYSEMAPEADLEMFPNEYMNSRRTILVNFLQVVLEYVYYGPHIRDDLKLKLIKMAYEEYTRCTNFISRWELLYSKGRKAPEFVKVKYHFPEWREEQEKLMAAYKANGYK